MTATPTLIRDLFLHPRPTYTSADAAEAIGMSVEDVEGWMEVGGLEGEAARDGVVLSWGPHVALYRFVPVQAQQVNVPRLDPDAVEVGAGINR